MEKGPHCSGSRTDIAKVKTWAATSQIYVKVRQILSEKIQLNANTNHKCTPGTRSLHNNNVKRLKKLESSETDLLYAGKARDKATGKELPEKVIGNLIKQTELEMRCICCL